MNAKLLDIAGPHRWIRFRLRTLLIFVAAVAIAFAWIAKEQRQSRREAQLLQQLDWHYSTPWLRGPFVSWEEYTQDIPPTWWRHICGDVLGHRVFKLGPPPPEIEFRDAAPLTTLTNLHVLHLYDSKVSDLSPLAVLTHLRRLSLSRTPVSDLKPLAGLNKLEKLWINGTQVHDLTPLHGLQSLKILDLKGCPVTPEQIEALQRALPNCKLVNDPAPL